MISVRFSSTPSDGMRAIDWHARARALQRRLDALREYASISEQLDAGEVREILDAEFAHD